MIEKLLRPHIQNLKPYVSAKSMAPERLPICLDANESPLGTYRSYPDGNATDLKKAIAHQKNSLPEQIFVGNGSDEVIDLLIRLFCRPQKDAICCLSPTYSMYAILAAQHEVKTIDVPLNEDFSLPHAQLMAVLEEQRPKILFLCSPNNPTGNSMENMEAIVHQFKGIVVVDEAYIDFSKEPSLSSKINQYPNLVVLQTLSKAWGMAALRIGMAFSNEKIINWLHLIKPPYNIGGVHQNLAIQVLQETIDFEEQVRILVAEREKMRVALQRIACVVQVFPSEANFFLVAFKDKKLAFQRLKDTGILVRDRSSQVENCLRITIGTSRENEMVLNVLSEI